MLIEIELNFARQDFENLYFEGNKGSYLWSSTTKVAFTFLLAVGVALVGLIFYSFFTDVRALLMGVGFIFVLATFNYLDRFLLLRKWRAKILKDIDEVQKHKNNKLILTDNYFNLIQGEKECIEKWKNFTSVEIHEQYTRLTGTNTFLIPRNSMTEAEYITFRKIVSDQVK